MISRDSAIEKVRACLALSKSSNEHEAAQALKQAHALIRKYKLEGVQFEEKVVSVKIKTDIRKPQRWETRLFCSIASLFSCYVVIHSGKNCDAELEFCGNDGDPSIAAYAYEVVYRQAKLAKRNYRATVDVERSKKMKLTSAYLDGWTSRVVNIVNENLCPQPLPDNVKEHEENRGLVEYKQKPEKEFISLAEYEAVQRGYADGSSVQISRPLN